MDNLQNTIKLTRKVFNSNTFQKFNKFMSILDDIAHLDIKNIRNTINNKDGFNKCLNLFVELTLVYMVLKDNTDSELSIFYHMQEYEIDVDKILNLLEDPQVIKYLDDDLRAKKRMNNKFTESIEFLKRYKNWKYGTN